MSIRKNTSILVSALLSAGIAAAATNLPEPETPGSAGPQAVAEAIHNARLHGIEATARQPAAQAPGSEQAQSVAESRHLPKLHGQVNDAADRRMLKEASRL